jgi:CO/xanthine dehydrogenase FAD-binding subunit
MRASPAEYEISTPGTLPGALSLLAGSACAWLPIAGGTDVMVLYSAGKLAPRRLLNIWNLAELRGIEVLPHEIRVKACCTFTEIRNHPVIRNEFPLLAQAASWTGSIANQNRGTLGGNIANASPAADSLPALLVYEAELLLASVRGDRRVPYRNFHQAYKKMDLAPDELIRSICLPRNHAGYFSYARKVGPRNAQAISKVCIAALGKIRHGLIEDIRVALGSVAPIPLRLEKCEHALLGNKLDSFLRQSTWNTLASEIRPIDDIRSSASYRSAVAQNLLAEFLEMLLASEVAR